MIKNLVQKYKTILSYGMISVMVTLVDVVITYILKNFTLLVVANSIGVISGAIIQYITNAKLVFHINQKSTTNLLIYISTFIFGLIIANLIIYYSDLVLNFYLDNEQLCFILAKGLSIVIPFFVLYFIRKQLYNKFN